MTPLNSGTFFSLWVVLIGVRLWVFRAITDVGKEKAAETREEAGFENKMEDKKQVVSLNNARQVSFHQYQFASRTFNLILEPWLLIGIPEALICNTS